MAIEQTGIERFISLIDEFVPGVSMDCVVLGYYKKTLHVLLLKWKNSELWSLPGGFLRRSELLEEAVNRVLLERTGLQDIFLRQFHTFSSLERNRKREELRQSPLYHLMQEETEESRDKVIDWLSQRFISTGFLALLDAEKVNPAPDHFSDTCTWVPLNSLPDLILDHQEIIEKALFHLKVQLNYWPIGHSLLPEKFRMTDLQTLYEVILQKKLDRSNFQRKMLKLNILERHEKLMTGAANKAPYLYSFDETAYFKLLEEGIGFS